MAAYEIVRPVGQVQVPAPRTPTRPERCWGVEDVAAFLDVPVRTVYEWRRTGYGPRGRRVGRWLRYDPAEVRTWFADLDDRPAAG
ncbi:helix-turn-helix domain-containing protein [Actinomycetospora soli]|uniref:helix-turn-helix domain-containing protein n=1 Tax=Actinomycetospora soli TaxID=2893887 RepID=UPI0027E2AFD0|nr:helix-turn-helix domain-containing protein [Actinomycetospora soli]